MVHLLAGAHNWEFQQLTKFKDVLGEQNHLLVEAFYTKEQHNRHHLWSWKVLFCLVLSLASHHLD